MTAAALLQAITTALADAGLAWMVGATCARWWLRPGGDTARAALVAALRRSELAAAAACFAGLAGSLWAAAATMSGDPLGEAAPALWTMLARTAYGRTGLAGLGAMAVAAMLIAVADGSRRRDVALLGVLLAFAGSRASVSHAGDDGLLRPGLAVEWIHLVLVVLWAGGVSVAGWLVLPLAGTGPAPSPPFIRYLGSLSAAATIALAGIVATGVYNAWERVGTLANLAGSGYGTTLLWKLGFVGGAAALGAWNRFAGFPGLLRSGAHAPRVTAVLRVESLLLLGAFLAAALLAAQQPPTAT